MTPLSPALIEQLAANLKRNGLRVHYRIVPSSPQARADTPAAVIANGTLDKQEVVTAPLESIAAAGERVEPPVLAVIGDVVPLGERISPVGPMSAGTTR